MKRLVVVAAVVAIAVVGLASPAQASASNDRAYVNAIRNEAPELHGVKSKDLIKTAKLTCRALRAGSGMFDLITLAENNGLETDTATALIAGAVVFYCPDQETNY